MDPARAGVQGAIASAAVVSLALLTIPLWLLAGVPEVPGLVALGAFAALAGIGLGLAIQARLRGPARGAVAAGIANGLLLALAGWILWAWGTSLAEPPCPTC